MRGLYVLARNAVRLFCLLAACMLVDRPAGALIDDDDCVGMIHLFNRHHSTSPCPIDSYTTFSSYKYLWGYSFSVDLCDRLRPDFGVNLCSE